MKLKLNYKSNGNNLDLPPSFDSGKAIRSCSTQEDSLYLYSTLPIRNIDKEKPFYAYSREKSFYSILHDKQHRYTYNDNYIIYQYDVNKEIIFFNEIMARNPLAEFPFSNENLTTRKCLKDNEFLYKGYMLLWHKRALRLFSSLNITYKTLYTHYIFVDVYMCKRCGTLYIKNDKYVYKTPLLKKELLYKIFFDFILIFMLFCLLMRMISISRGEPL